MDLLVIISDHTSVQFNGDEFPGIKNLQAKIVEEFEARSVETEMILKPSILKITVLNLRNIM